MLKIVIGNFILLITKRVNAYFEVQMRILENSVGSKPPWEPSVHGGQREINERSRLSQNDRWQF